MRALKLGGGERALRRERERKGSEMKPCLIIVETNCCCWFLDEIDLWWWLLLSEAIELGSEREVKQAKLAVISHTHTEECQCV